MSLLVQAANFHSAHWEFCSFQCQSGFLSADCWWLMLIDSDRFWLMLIDADGENTRVPMVIKYTIPSNKYNCPKYLIQPLKYQIHHLKYSVLLRGYFCRRGKQHFIDISFKVLYCQESSIKATCQEHLFLLQLLRPLFCLSRLRERCTEWWSGGHRAQICNQVCSNVGCRQYTAVQTASQRDAGWLFRWSDFQPPAVTLERVPNLEQHVA